MKKVLVAIFAVAIILGSASIPAMAGKGNGGGNSGGNSGNSNGGGNGQGAGNANDRSSSAGGVNGLGVNNYGQAISPWAQMGYGGLNIGGLGNSDGDRANGTAHGDGLNHRSGRVQSYLNNNFNIGSSRY